MKEESIPIDRMAAMNRVSVPTLRLYDEKGLLKPRYVDPKNGYRYYDINQNARLDMIAYMKELGMTLSQIADVLQKEDISLIEELLSRKNEQIHQQIRQLKAQHDAVERAIQSIGAVPQISGYRHPLPGIYRSPLHLGHPLLPQFL